MTPIATLSDRVSQLGPDDGRPLFLNSDYNSADDLGDWWLDIGQIDLPMGGR